jgi:hypothetical protein
MVFSGNLKWGCALGAVCLHTCPTCPGVQVFAEPGIIIGRIFNMEKKRKRQGFGFVSLVIVAAAWAWQLGYAAIAAIAGAATDPPKCVAGWHWPEPLPWSACRGLGLGEKAHHLLGVPGDFAMYPFAVWPHIMEPSVYLQPMVWLQSAIYLAGLWWAFWRLVPGPGLR